MPPKKSCFKKGTNVADLEQMPYKIRSKECIAPKTFKFVIECAHVARSFKPGQFVMLKHDAGSSERIPLSVADVSASEGSITLIIVAVGRTSTEVTEWYKAGDSFYSILGPLGTPLHVEKLDGAFLAVGGGFGSGALFPITKSYAEAGNRILGIVGSRNESLLVFANELASLCDNFLITTDDGSTGLKGLVTDGIKEFLKTEKIALILCIGPVPMMRAVAELTRPMGIKTLASINPIMVDGTGMCGGCRVTVDGKPRFTCFEGPKFDAHQVDFAELTSRLATYRDHEKVALEKMNGQPCETDETLDLIEKVSALKGNGKAKYPEKPPVLPLGVTMPVPIKHRLKVGKQEVPHQDADERRHNFEEVVRSFMEETAVVESFRCIECKDSPCIAGCPVNINIPDFVEAVRGKKFEEAYKIITKDNLFPAVCGRVCPQEEQCEMVCTIGKKVKPVSIGRLERFVADYVRTMKTVPALQKPQPNGKSVAIVGSGPAGLSCAFELAVRGYAVTVYEALHKPGGVLSYGIPPFRLPREIVQYEIGRLKELGVTILTDHLIGRTFSVEELLQRFDAVFIATGAGHPLMLNVPGENLKGVYSANEFLTRINLMHADEFPMFPTPVRIGRNVAVIGGGNTAMDGARVSLRLGAKNVYLIYRRSVEDLPARKEEVENAEEEGVQFMDYTVPVEFRGNKDGFVEKIICMKTESYGEPDPKDKQRRRPVREVPGTNFAVEVDTIINALGFVVNPLIPQTTPGLKMGRKNIIIADGDGKTSLERVYAGGDAITGGATVISALGQGKKASLAIHKMLSEDPTTEPDVV